LFCPGLLVDLYVNGKYSVQTILELVNEFILKSDVCSESFEEGINPCKIQSMHGRSSIITISG
jgi:hypothetical protein